MLVENELKNLKTFDLSYFTGKSEVDGTQNYLVFEPIQRYFKRIVGAEDDKHIYYWKSKGLSDERINSIKTSDYGITPHLSYYDNKKIGVKFDRGYLNQDRPAIIHLGITNIYIVYEITANFNVISYSTLKALTLINVDILVDLIDMGIFHFLALDSAETQYVLEYNEFINKN